jgi:oligopeptide transport system ATP-binding protein
VTTEPLLSVRGLTTRFRTDRGPLVAVHDVSFDVAPGETLAIVGESGSGKSVTALSILRLIPNPPGEIVAGQIVFEGHDLLKMSDAEMLAIRGNRIAMIFQEPMNSLNPALTVGLQVAEPMRQHRGVSWAAALDGAKALLKKVHIPDAESRLHTYPHQYSGGMRQRAMIAMALACRPRLIIADEPTTALDVTVQAQILALIDGLRSESKMAVLLVSHDLAVIAGHCDRVIVMYAGTIMESGPVEAVLRQPRNPYTLALLEARPRPGAPRGARLKTIPGAPPGARERPRGCPFADRCALAIAICRAVAPPEVAFGADHVSRCHRADEVGRAQ